MIKLKFKKAIKPKVLPYFEVRFWNIPRNGMKTYTLEKINGNNKDQLKEYIAGFFTLQHKIKNNKILFSDLKIEKTVKNSIETYTKYFYKVSKIFSIQVALENEHKNTPEICSVELDCVKYFDEYGEEYNIEVQLISELLEKF